MKASRKTSFLAGLLSCGVLFLAEALGIHFMWFMLPVWIILIVFVIGFDTMKRLQDNTLFLLPFYWPRNPAGWRIYTSAWVRILSWFIGIVLAASLYLTGYALWENHFAYYWHTDKFKGRYVGDFAYLCGDTKQYIPVTTLSPENNLIIERAIKAANGKKVIYFEGRGFIERENGHDTIRIVELSQLSHEDNPECRP